MGIVLKLRQILYFKFRKNFLKIKICQSLNLGRRIIVSRRSVRIRQLALPSRRSFDVQLSSGSKARVQLLLPPSWREELRDAAFPVLVHV